MANAGDGEPGRLRNFVHGVERLVALFTAAVLLAPGIAAANNKVGGWSGLAPWPLIPIHAVLLPDGRVLSYGTASTRFAPDAAEPPRAGQQTGYFDYDVWDPRQGLGGGHLTLPNGTFTDLFCSAQLVLPQSGDVLIVGGDNWDTTEKSTTNTGNNRSLLFDYSTAVDPPPDEPLERGVDMNQSRWYATPTTLPDGRIYIQGGQGGGVNPEIRELDGTFRELGDVITTSLNSYYPRNFVAPDGRIFGYADRTMYYVNLDNAGNGSLTPAGTMPADGPSGASSSEVMYAPGRILRVGGGTNKFGEQGGSQDPSKSAAAVIDINGAAPTYKRANSMPVSLHWSTATVLADGRVVVTGGSQRANELVGVNNRALIWRPDTGSWTKGAVGSGRARLYHAIALLLPDGSVLVGGGGAPGPQTNLNAEIYYPPYLYNSSGGFATRPRITSAPDRIPVGQTFSLGVDRAAAIRRVTLVKAGSVTHSFDFEQRFMELKFARAGGELQVTGPDSVNAAPPGNYLLFVIDDKGVPSLGRLLPR